MLVAHTSTPSWGRVSCEAAGEGVLNIKGFVRSAGGRVARSVHSLALRASIDVRRPSHECTKFVLLRYSGSAPQFGVNDSFFSLRPNDVGWRSRFRQHRQSPEEKRQTFPRGGFHWQSNAKEKRPIRSSHRRNRSSKTSNPNAKVIVGCGFDSY